MASWTQAPAALRNSRTAPSPPIDAVATAARSPLNAALAIIMPSGRPSATSIPSWLQPVSALRYEWTPPPSGERGFSAVTSMRSPDRTMP